MLILMRVRDKVSLGCLGVRHFIELAAVDIGQLDGRVDYMTWQRVFQRII